MQVQPKRIIPSAKFGVSILPSKTYQAEADGDRILVQIKPGTPVRLMVEKNDVNIVAA